MLLLLSNDKHNKLVANPIFFTQNFTFMHFHKFQTMKSGSPKIKLKSFELKLFFKYFQIKKR